MTVAKAAPLTKELGNPVIDEVALSTKGKASAAAAARVDGGTSGASGAPTPTVASLFQAKAEENATKGPMANAFVAGPDQPWGSRWVFAGGNQPAPEEIEAMRTSGGKPAPLTGAVALEQLKKLVEQSKAQGGDGTQLKQAAESTLKDLDSAIAAVGGELESVRTNPVDADGNPVKPTPNVLGGAEFISALQGAKGGNSGGTGANGSGLGGRSNGRASMALGGVENGNFAQAKSPGFEPSLSKDALNSDFGLGAEAASPLNTQANSEKPVLQLIPGGMSSGSGPESGRLEGGLRLAKDEPKLQTDTFYPNGMPLTAARPDGLLGAGGTPPQTITGHVVPGAMMRERLTSESLRNVANGITNMTVAGGGEMRIKLNPGNLGELSIRVSTNGKDVGLKVQANDPAAKKVIEESLGALRDSLASQSLQLGRVDVTVATTAAQTDLGQNSQHSSQNHASFAGFDGQNPNPGRSMDGFNGSEDRSSRSSDQSGNDRTSSRGISSRIAAMNAGGASARAAASSRLDVMA